jgi:hypothetical protein
VAVLPEELIAMKVYVVVAAGETTCDPCTATEAPFSVALVAFFDDQVSVELPPNTIEVGLAVILAVGGGVEAQITAAGPINKQAAMSKSRNSPRCR